MKMNLSRNLLFLCLFAVLFLVAGCRTENDDSLAADPIPRAFVQRVIDGDTFVLDNGERVRFIGVNAPEMTPKPPEPGAEAATKFVKDKVEGKHVWLEADGDDRDRYGRLRRYIWLQRPADPRNEQEIRRFQLNALLLEQGHAVTMIIGKPKNADLFRRIEAEAKKKGRIQSSFASFQ